MSDDLTSAGIVTFQAVLPFPPSLNNAFSQKRDGRRFTSKKYAAWRREADLVLILAKRDRTLGVGPARIDVALRAPDKRGRDADNLLKPVIDALVRSQVLAGDSQKFVREVSSRWESGNAGATVTVTWGR